MKICYLSSECVPFIKTGGLADVSGSLPAEIQKNRNEMKVFLPLYDLIDYEKNNLEEIPEYAGSSVFIGGKEYFYSLHYAEREGVSHFFIGNNDLYNRKSVYTNAPDEDMRFIFFQYAVLNVIQRMQWSPDVIHCHDWQSALIPELLKTSFSWDKLFSNTKTLLTIHNLAYQGIFGIKTVRDAGLPENKILPGGLYEHNGLFNFMKTGILTADYISTVSQSYAEEIKTSEYGEGLQSFIQMRSDRVSGILNGVDTLQWNPQTDNIIPQNYGVESVLLKKVNKSALLKFAGMQDTAVPVIGIVSRFAYQKGFELFESFIDSLMQKEIRMIVLGDGESKYVDFFKNAVSRFPEKLFLHHGYSNELAHLITAGADIFLMPSRYEPCGLNQMYSFIYGTIPVVRKTGGLADTVTDIEDNPETGNGYAFENFEPGEFYNKICKALEHFNDKEKWIEMQTRGMNSDFTWGNSANKYIELYNKMCLH